MAIVVALVGESPGQSVSVGLPPVPPPRTVPGNEHPGAGKGNFLDKARAGSPGNPPPPLRSPESPQIAQNAPSGPPVGHHGGISSLTGHLGVATGTVRAVVWPPAWSKPGRVLRAAGWRSSTLRRSNGSRARAERTESENMHALNTCAGGSRSKRSKDGTGRSVYSLSCSNPVDTVDHSRWSTVGHKGQRTSV